MRISLLFYKPVCFVLFLFFNGSSSVIHLFTCIKIKKIIIILTFWVSRFSEGFCASQRIFTRVTKAYDKEGKWPHL